MNHDELIEVAPGLSAKIEIPSMADYACAGIYFLFYEDEVVYVGQAGDMRRRVGEHIAERTKKFDAVSFMPHSLSKLTKLEAKYIEALRPRYNNCNLSQFLRKTDVPLRKLKVIEKRMPRHRQRRKVVILTDD